MDTFANGQMIIDHLNELQHYHLIFLDIQLPDYNGFEIARFVRQFFALQTLPIIAMTAYAQSILQAEVQTAGMNEVLEKPITYEALVQVLQQYASFRPIHFEI